MAGLCLQKFRSQKTENICRGPFTQSGTFTDSKVDDNLPKIIDAEVEGYSAVSSFIAHQEMLKELYKLEPDECLEKIAERLQEIFNCETVCILLWNEGKQKLITEYQYGMPVGLDVPEEYGADQGVTGRIIFSEGRRIRCLVDISARRIFDLESELLVEEGTTNWHNMESYEAQSTHKAFKSLLGAPLYVRSQKLGAVKLINKLSEEGRLSEKGFQKQEVESLSYFLDAIENIVGIKRSEKQVQSLLRIGEKIINTGSNYEDILTEIAVSCADVLNYRICFIRFLEGNHLTIKASNVSLPIEGQANTKHTPAAKAVEHRTAFRWALDGDKASRRIVLKGENKTVTLSNVNPSFPKFLNQYDLKSFLIVPIKQRGVVIGTIECYTSLQREFSTYELNAIRMYIDALVISTISSRQHELLTSLIEMQRIGVVSQEGGGEEDRVIKGVINRTRELLTRRLKTVAVIFSKERLDRLGFRCEQQYGARPNVLKSKIGKKKFEEIIEELRGQTWHLPGPTQNDARIPRVERIAHRDIETIKAWISTDRQSAPFGVLLISIGESESKDDFPEQVARLGADYLGVTLGNIVEFRRTKELLRILEAAPRKESHGDMLKFILEQTTGLFGFDFGAIYAVDHIRRRIESRSTRTVKRDLVNPEDWKSHSTYSWDDNDILVDVFNNKKEIVIDAAAPGETPDPRLNKEIYSLFKHKNLARIWVPFIFRRSEGEGAQEDLVLGIIEAGYHRQTQAHIGQQEKDLFVLFVNSCANSLQRVALLDERKSVDDLINKFDQERDPKSVLRKLVESAAKLVGAEWGDITLLTHEDDKISFRDETLSYNLPEIAGPFAKELSVGPSGRTGIVGHVAWEAKAYWSNNVATGEDPYYVEEDPKVNCELAVPLRFSGRVIGVLDLNSYELDWFDERKANLVQALADQGTALYQTAKARAPLDQLVSPFNPFATPSEIHSQVIEIIEKFLSTKTVSIWKRRTKGDSFELDLVRASEELWEKYGKANIKTLPPSTFTGRAAAGEEYVAVRQHEITTQFYTPQFAEENQLRSMTAVPIKIGDEIYGAIDVFSRRDTTLFPEEVISLRVLATKAAIAIQSATLVESFNNIARISPGDDIRSILKRIAQNAVEILHAEPVILFRYDALDNPKFDLEAVIAGKLFHEKLRIVTNENHMANFVLNRPKPLYLTNEKEYLEFERECGRKWNSDRFKEDFWHREKIKSLAAFKVENGAQILGVMFINYREPQTFSDSVERVFKVFASQAASAIYNAKLSDQNKLFWEKQRSDSFALTVSEVVTGMAHNSGHLLGEINHSFSQVDKLLNKPKLTERQLTRIRTEVDKMKGPLDDLERDFKQLRAYWKFDEMTLKEHDVNSLVSRSVDMLTDAFKERRVTVHTRYAPNLPKVSCDDIHIRHVFINLFLNAIEAMEHKGKLSIATTFNSQTGKVAIRISDTGPGISVDNREQIFVQGFSTKKKKAGSGYGLPISRRIVLEHNGSIELGPSSSKGATFTILLPMSE